MLDGVPLTFPDGFLWGSATSSHQVEGGNDNNQWWDWEHQPGRIWNGDRSADACGWWRNAERDLERAAQLGQNAHRLSVEWSRIEPRQGEFDDAAIARYRQILEFMRGKGIKPMVTLHHFTNPRWLEERGGWLWAGTPELFARFSKHVVSRLGDICNLWCTINEPVIYAVMGYLLGLFPPGRTGLPETVRVVAGMLRAHALAASAVRAASANANVGIVHHMRLFTPASQNGLDGLVARTWDYLCNTAFLQALETGILPPPLGWWERVPGLRGSNDFVGLNYYTREHISFDASAPQMGFGRRFTPDHLEQSDNGRDGHTYGEVYPDGLEVALKRIARLNCPIFVTEFGLPDATDDQRPRFLVRHLRVVHRAISRGLDVRGVFHWSLTDNFEWAEGWGLRFGLIALDQLTQERTDRPSAQVYARMARANAIPDDLLESM
jgi:beta-glucosidase